MKRDTLIFIIGVIVAMVLYYAYKRYAKFQYTTDIHNSRYNQYVQTHMSPSHKNINFNMNTLYNKVKNGLVDVSDRVKLNNIYNKYFTFISPPNRQELKNLVKKYSHRLKLVGVSVKTILSQYSRYNKDIMVHLDQLYSYLNTGIVDKEDIVKFNHILSRHVNMIDVIDSNFIKGMIRKYQHRFQNILNAIYNIRLELPGTYYGDGTRAITSIKQFPYY